MDKEKCLKRVWGTKEDKKKIQVNIRLTQKLSDWLRKENLSPTAIFNAAVKELDYKE